MPKNGHQPSSLVLDYHITLWALPITKYHVSDTTGEIFHKEPPEDARPFTKVETYAVYITLTEMLEEATQIIKRNKVGEPISIKDITFMLERSLPDAFRKVYGDDHCVAQHYQ